MALTMTSVDRGCPTAGIWLELTSSSMLTLKIHIWTSKDTACLSIVPPSDLFVLLSLSLVLKTPACTEMLRWALDKSLPSSQDANTPINPFPFSPAFVSWVWFSWWQAGKPWFWLQFIRVPNQDEKHVSIINRCRKSIRLVNKYYYLEILTEN